MPAKHRETRSAQAYFPVAVFEQLEKRAEKHFNSVSREIVQLVAEMLQQETQKQEQPKEALAQ